MKILNLTKDGATSQIKFKPIHFPDGQTDIVVDPESVKLNLSLSTGIIPCAQIYSHFNSWEDMALIICATRALRDLKVKEIHLFIPYILGARSDRRFQKGGTSYLVDIVAPVLNMQNYESITCIDAHSDVAQACIKNLTVIDNTELVKWALQDIYQGELGNYVLTAPDQGASKKMFNVAHELESTNGILFCTKHRDQISGKILHTEVPLKDIHFQQPTDYIIVDDICDGGRTFAEIAKAIHTRYDQQKELTSEVASFRIFLVVTHGIFSNKFSVLNKCTDGIYTTNSITTWGYDCEYSHDLPKNLKVMDIFESVAELQS